MDKTNIPQFNGAAYTTWDENSIWLGRKTTDFGSMRLQGTSEGHVPGTYHAAGTGRSLTFIS